ncbi:MAG TPA: glycosyltransferase, partial [Roseiflexaceae bacterium]|nr:glycosyltransferase [Roseiflexaceae bacterium]
IKVVEVELSQPLAEFSGLVGYQALQGLVRLHGAPLGWVRLPLSNGHCSAAALSKAILEQYSWPIIRHLVADGLHAPLGARGLRLEDLLEQPHPRYRGTFPTVTVVVCTRERTADLARCLAALARLEYPALELLVVDNAPRSEATRQLVSQYPQVRYVREPRPGLSWARNRAIMEARGQIVAFTDDDVVVDAGWVAALARVFAENRQVMAVTGLVVPYELETEPQQLFEQYGGFGRGFERQWHCLDITKDKQKAGHHGAGKFGTGANMAFRRSIFQQIGCFDPALGVGTPTNGGEDLEMFFRVLHEGYTLVYEPEALVWHRHRRDYTSLRSQIANNGVALFAYYVRSCLIYPDQREAYIRLARWWLWRWHVKRLLKSLLRPQRFPRDLILAEFVGCFVGLTRYHKSRHVTARLLRQVGRTAGSALTDSADQAGEHRPDQTLAPG